MPANMLRATDVLAIGQVAARTGLSIPTIRFYEAEGLITPMRAPGGARRFRRGDIRRLTFIRIAQGLGLTLAEIRDQIATLPDGRTPNARDWRRLSRAYAADLDRRIAVLTRLRDDLDGCIGCGCLSLDKCRLYNAGDHVSENGPGPQLLTPSG